MSPQDDMEIRNLIARIAWLTDKWTTPEEYLSNCSKDFSWQIEGYPIYQGHEGMGRRLREMLDAGVCGPGLATRHNIASIEVIPGATPDTARVQSFVMMTGLVEGRPTLMGYGDYYDEVRRENGRWLLVKRYCISFWDSPKQGTRIE